MKQYDKLVRDGVPAILLAGGHNPVSKTLVGKELLAALRAKVDEEVAEYDAALDDDQAADELADLVEIATAMARQRGCSENRMMQLRATRSPQLGVYDRGIFLVEMD